MIVPKPTRNAAWLGVLPVLLIVAFSAVIPLMTVVNYSVQDILDFNSRFFVGLEWSQATLTDPRFTEAFLRQIAFSASILAIEVPLGILIAKGINRDSRWVGFWLVLLAIPLLIPWNVVGTICVGCVGSQHTSAAAQYRPDQPSSLQDTSRSDRCDFTPQPRDTPQDQPLQQQHHTLVFIAGIIFIRYKQRMFAIVAFSRFSIKRPP